MNLEGRDRSNRSVAQLHSGICPEHLSNVKNEIGLNLGLVFGFMIGLGLALKAGCVAS